MADGPHLADTNILLRLLQPRDPDYPVVRRALEELRSRGAWLCFTPQNLAEFWSVCTRPVDRNGFGLSVSETDRRARLIESAFVLLPDNDQIYLWWRRLVVEHGVTGVQVHDARLVAAMITHGISTLITLNDRDLTRYPQVTALHPGQLVGSR